jgi:uncharacterized protein YktA (UPF0223 family)
MEQKVINAALNDFRGILDAAEVTPRSYERKAPAPKFTPDYARFKLVVWFKDGNRRYFFSYDTANFDGRTHVDEYSALKKLIRLVHKYKDLYKNAIIYASIDPDRKTTANYCYQVIKWDIYGNMRANKAVNFKTDQKNNILDLQKLLHYGSEKI